LESFGINKDVTSLKFVNDYFINDFKVGGVLCRSEIGNSFLLQIGIGVNLNVDKEIYIKQGLNEASSAFAETGQKIDVKEFYLRLTNALLNNMKLLQEKGFSPFVPILKEKMRLLGKNVVVYNKLPNNPNDIKIIGTFIDITNEGYAVIENSEGTHIITDGRMRLFTPVE
jgi:biotin-(acetyl-CoA carboxylase) ligase